MFALAVIVAGYETHGYSFGIGTFGTKKNPLWGQRIEGLQKCQNNNLSYKYSTLYSQVLLNFSGVDDAEDSTLVHCSTQLDDDLYKKWNNLIQKQPFLRFHSGFSTTRVKPYMNYTGNISIFTHYTFQVALNSPKENPVMKVSAQNLTRFEPNATLDFTFSVKFSDEPVEKGGSNIPYIFILIFTITLILVIVFRFQIQKKYQVITSVEIDKVWNFNKAYMNMLVFITFGVITLNIFFVWCLLGSNKQDPLITYVTATLFGVAFPTILRSFIAKVFYSAHMETEYVSPSIVNYSVMIIPYFCVTVINWVLWRSWIGPHPFYYPSYIGILLTEFVITRSLGGVSYFVTPKFSVVEKIEPRPPSKNRSMPLIIDILYGVCCGVICIPVTDYFFELFLEGAPGNYSLILSTILLYSSAAMMISVARLTRSLKSDVSFISGHLISHFIAGIIIVIYCVLYIVTERGIGELEDIVYCVVPVCFAFGFAFGVGTGASFLTSWCVVYSLFRNFGRGTREDHRFMEKTPLEMMGISDLSQLKMRN